MSFYFDPERNRYFRVVNGDQRLNSRYSNNTLQAEKRRSDYEDSLSRKKARETTLDECRQSINFAALKTSGDFCSPLLHAKLNLRHLMPPKFLPLSKFDGMRWSDVASLWPGLDLNTVFTVRKGAILLQTIDDYLRSTVSLDWAKPNIYTMTVDSLDSLVVTQCMCNDGRYMFAIVSGRLILLEWIAGEGGIFQVKNHSGRFHESDDMRNAMRRIDNTDLRLTSACFVGNKLYLFTDAGLWIIEVTTFSILHHLEKNLGSVGKKVGDYWVSMDRGRLRLHEFTDSLKSLASIPSGSFVINFFADEYRRQSSSGVQKYIRFFIIMPQAIVIQDFDCQKLRTIGERVKIRCFDDNVIRPVVDRVGNQLLIEQCRGKAKLFDLDTYSVSDCDIKVPYGDEPVHLLHLSNRLFASTWSQTFEISIESEFKYAD